MRRRALFLPVLAGVGLWLYCALGCGQPSPPQSKPAGSEVSLPPAKTTGAMSVEEALSKRRSVRQFQERALGMEQIGQLAWAAQGITRPETGFRTAPSAGALYPLELYLLTGEGIFHYVPREHKLVQVSPQDRRGELMGAAFGQRFVGAAPLSMVIAGVYERTRAKYGARAELYVHLEAGHVAQNVHLQAVALGLGSVPVGAFEPGAVAKALGLPSEETPLYIIPVGYPAAR